MKNTRDWRTCHRKDLWVIACGPRWLATTASLSSEALLRGSVARPAPTHHHHSSSLHPPFNHPLHSQCQASGGGGGGRGGAVGPKQQQFTRQQMRHARSRSCPPPHGVRVRGRGAPSHVGGEKVPSTRDFGMMESRLVQGCFQLFLLCGLWVSSTTHTARTRYNPTETRFTDHQPLHNDPGTRPRSRHSKLASTTTWTPSFARSKFQTLARVGD
jgi:hypothetical protein